MLGKTQLCFFLTALKTGSNGQTFDFEAPEHDINGYK